jgi:pimeloyl-ACP methyl ester carboxylesterase
MIAPSPPSKGLGLPQQAWADEACVLCVDEPGGADVVLVFFAGFGGGFGGMPAFEFRNTVADVPAHKVFLRDRSSLWYLAGLPGIGDSADAIAAYLRDHCARLGAKRIVTVGNSSGGFAALLFGILIDADEVHAFAPKTRLLEAQDFHDQEKLRLIHRHVGRDHPYLDIRKLVLDGRGARTTLHIHYPNGDAVDAGQARRVADLPNVRLWKYRWRTHALVRVLKQYGALRPILCSAISGSPARLRLLVGWVRLRMRIAVIRGSIARRLGSAPEPQAAAD